MLRILDSERVKMASSPDYNYVFNKKTGEFLRWGKDFNDDPRCAHSAEIADIEISAGGRCRARCDFCYKSNGVGEHKNMSVEDFDAILSKIPTLLTQVALGITDIDAHPQLIEILQACRDRGVVPNFTTNGLAFDKVDLPRIVSLVGAIAVSCYPHLGKDVCYDAVKQLTDLGPEQVNIHLLYHQDNLPFVYEVLADTTSDPRLEKLNATVLLGLKPKGRAEEGFAPLSKEEFTKLVAYCLEKNLRIGFDSCSAAKFEHALDKIELADGMREQLLQMSERCESTLFSVYINVDGKAYPCSFTEIGEGVDVLGAEDFVKDVWNSELFVRFREGLLQNDRR